MDICSICNQEFETEKKYLVHKCTTGYKPSEFDHQVKLNPNYKLISDSALKRGIINN